MRIYETELKNRTTEGKKVVVIITDKEEEHYCKKCPNTTGYIEVIDGKKKQRIEVKPIECPCNAMRVRATTITQDMAQVYKEVGRWEDFLKVVEKEVIIDGNSTE